MAKTDAVNPDPVRVLVEDDDPVQRSRAHLELGKRAWARKDVKLAARHFREAADLDPSAEAPAHALRDLGEPVAQRPPMSEFGRWLFGRRAR